MPSTGYLDAEPAPASSGDAELMSQPNPSLPQKPELVTLSPVEHLLHNAAQLRGQGEGMAQASAALVKTSADYKAMDSKLLSAGQKGVVCDILNNLSTQMAAQADKSRVQQNVALGQWIVARGAAGGSKPRRVGWAVRWWRASVARAWAWAFAK